MTGCPVHIPSSLGRRTAWLSVLLIQIIPGNDGNPVVPELAGYLQHGAAVIDNAALIFFAEILFLPGQRVQRPDKLPVQGVGVFPPAPVYVHVGWDGGKDRPAGGASRKLQYHSFLARQHVNIPHLAALAFYLTDGHTPVCMPPDLLRLHRRQLMAAQSRCPGKGEDIPVFLFKKAFSPYAGFPLALKHPCHTGEE